jgi:X-Pro dipeptidyl-peptidase
MRRRSTIATALVLAAVLVSFQAPPASAAYSSKSESYIVDTRHGQIYVEVVRPVDETGATVRGPAIFTLSPYSILGRNSDASRWVPRGYARVWADVVGTGNSGGCWDYGATREKETGYDLVEWIAAQPWSTGKVGMTGGSYNGTTATATAVANPRHLTTIVPEAGISRWYEYAFSGGIRYFLNNEFPADEGFDTPLAFDFGLAIPPPLDVAGSDWADRVASTIRPCDELQHTQHGYDNDTPDYDAFWLERDYIVDADQIDIPVLVAHNWGDWNVKQEEAINLYRALTNSPDRKLYMGTRWSGHGRPGGDYRQTVDAWFDHYLMGVENGIETSPDVVSQTSTYDGPAAWNEGPWPRTTAVRLQAQFAPGEGLDDYPWKLLPRKPKPRLERAGLSIGANTETAALADPRKNTQWLWFETPPLAQDVRIFGNPEVRIRSTIERTWITYTPTIVDIDLSKRVVGPGMLAATDDRGLYSTTRGWLDSRYRKTLASPSLVSPGSPFTMTVVEKPQDYTFKQGHVIGLMLTTEIDDWSLPKPYPCSTPACALASIEWVDGETSVTLPVVGAVNDPASLFAP